MADTERATTAARSPGAAGIIYGILSVATVIAAEGTRRETYGALVGASAVTMALFWLAHAYADHLATRLRQPAEWTVRELLVCLEHEATIFAGAALPVIALILSWATGGSVGAGVTASLWCAGVELVVFELIASVRRHLSARDTVVETTIGASLGLGIVAIHLLLH